MPLSPIAQALVDLSIEFEWKLGFAHSPLGYDEKSDNGRRATLLEVINKLPDLEAAVDAAATVLPHAAAAAIAVQTSLANALNSGECLKEIKPARDAFKAATYAGNGVDEYIGPFSPSEWRKRFGKMSETTWRRRVKTMRVDPITPQSLRIHRDDVARYEKREPKPAI